MTLMVVFGDQSLDGEYNGYRLCARKTPDGLFAYPLSVLEGGTYAVIMDKLEAAQQIDVVWPTPEDVPDDQI